MEPFAVIIQRPEIIWQKFIAACQEQIGRSPTRSLDGARVQPGLPPSFVAALGEFQHADTPPLSFLKDRESDHVLEHLTYSLLIASDNKAMVELVKLGRLKLIFADDSDVAIATGSLLDWRTIIKQGCHPKASKSLRTTVNRIQHAFAISGLSFLWQDMIRQTTNDGTVALVPKDRGHKGHP